MAMNLEEIALELAKELGAREARIHEREKKIERLDQQIDEKVSYIKELKDETEQVQKDCYSKRDMYRAQANDAQGELQVWQSKVKEAEGRLAQLKQEHEDQLNFQRGAQAALVKKLEEEMADKRLQLAQLNHYINEGLKRFQPLKG